jgi:3-hydroxyisobutyrate dehydrogenase-like beta-hydroxyacid dehydrogenase
MDVGFIGLGNMGAAMARRLIGAGHRLKVWNRSPGAAAAIEAAGATRVASPGEAFAGDAVITMLADDEALRGVIDSGVLDKAPRGLVHASMSTISVALAEDLTARHRQAGMAYVAAPVFGRPDAAEAGKLNILAAGDEAAIDRLQPLFDVMGQRTWRLGTEPQRANACKLAGNLMIACAIEAMGEATALGRAYGVAPSDLLDILTNTLFASPVYKGYGGSIAVARYEPAGFKLRLGLKDVRLALQAAEAKNVPLASASAIRDNLLEAMAAGDGDKDWSALAEVSSRRAGLKAG